LFVQPQVSPLQAGYPLRILWYFLLVDYSAL
jgi:hypothetical protein